MNLFRGILSSTRMSWIALALAACLAMPAPESRAAFIEFQTIAGGNVQGEPVDALASFTTSDDTIAITIQNRLADPNSVKQVVYDLKFTVSTGENSGTLVSATGIERTVDGDGTYDDSASPQSPNDWAVNTDGAQLHLDRLAFPGQKKHGIIGPPNLGTDEYDDAGGSIAGNNRHNPFFAETADFVLSVPGVTAGSTITAVSFSFNTSADTQDSDSVPGEPVEGPDEVPEPATWLLGALGGGVLGAWGWRRKRTSRSAQKPLHTT